jgi:hypothetical protein
LAKQRPRFFSGFDPGRYLLKVTGLFLALLGVGSAFADYSSWVSDLRDRIKAEEGTIFYAYGGWMLVSFAIELVRRKVRHDLAVLRFERAGRRRRR